MAKGKSFLIYIDIRKNLELLSDDEAGKVFKAIVEYADIGRLPQFGDRSLQVFFNTITDQIDRDREKYEKRCGVNRENQQKRWEKIREMESHYNTNVFDRKQSYTNVTDNDTDKDTDNDTDKDIKKRKSKRENAPCGSLSDNFMKWYNEQIQFTELPKITKMTAKREAALKEIIDEFGKEAIASVMSKVSTSDYLCGNTSKRFKANFDWIFRRDNFLKIEEGNYDD